MAVGLDGEPADHDVVRSKDAQDCGGVDRDLAPDLSTSSHKIDYRALEAEGGIVSATAAAAIRQSACASVTPAAAWSRRHRPASSP